MIMPFTHADDPVRRRPWFTYGLLAVCACASLLGHWGSQRRLSQGVETLERALAYHAARPYLALDPRLTPRTSVRPGSAPRKFEALEQVELDGLTRAGFDVLYRTPHWRFGVVPPQEPSPGLAAHLFLHAGLVPLALNLVLLFVTAPFLEEMWGASVVAGFSLAAGVLGAGAFAVTHSTLDAPFLGLSAVASALVGALTVRCWGRKLRFSYWLGPEKTGTVAVPVTALLGLWVLRETFALAFPDIVPAGSPPVTAGYWAHLPAFAVGSAAAFAARRFRFEEEYLGLSLPGEEAVAAGPCVPAEGYVNGEEDWPQAWNEAERHPDDPAAVYALCDLAAELGRVREVVPFLVRLFRTQVQKGDLEPSVALWERLRLGHIDVSVPFPVLAQFAERLHAAGAWVPLQDVLSAAAARNDGAESPSALLRLGRFASGETRHRIAKSLLGRSELPAPVREEAAQWARETGPEGPHENEPPAFTFLGGLRLVAAVPVALSRGNLTVELEGRGRKSVPPERIEGVAAAWIGAGPEGYALVDVLLGSSSGDPARRTVLRLDARRFDPTALVPTEPEPEDALLSIAGALVASSTASWLVGTGLGQLPRYPSLRDYEASLRGALGLSDS